MSEERNNSFDVILEEGIRVIITKSALKEFLKEQAEKGGITSV